MKVIYDKLRQYCVEAPYASYLYASRRAFNLAVIRNIDEFHIDFLTSGTSRLTVAKFLERIGLKSFNYIREIEQAGFSSPYDKVSTGLDYGRLRKLFRILAEVIEKKAAEERTILNAYLSKEGIINSKQNIAVVDIGWHGSLQMSLEHLLSFLGNENKITGYYLGTFPPAEHIAQQGHEMKAYLCNYGLPEEYHAIIKECVEIFEFIHNAPHGSVIKFEMDQDEIRPVLDNDVKTEKWNKAQILQQGAIDFVDDFIKFWHQVKFLDLSRDLALGPITRLLRFPDKEEAVNFGDLVHSEGFGDVYEKRYLAKLPSFKSLLLGPQNLIKGYRSAFWKKGYLKRCLTFK